MSLTIIKKIADKNNFIGITGEFYRDNNSHLIKRLKKEYKKIYFGIQNPEGVYTVIGKEYLFFSTAKGVEKRILNIDFFESAKKMGLRKNQEYEFVKVNECNEIWISNIQTLSVILGLLLFLTRTDGYGIKKKIVTDESE